MNTIVKLSGSREVSWLDTSLERDQQLELKVCLSINRSSTTNFSDPKICANIP